jgi:hypothetical protein
MQAFHCTPLGVEKEKGQETMMLAIAINHNKYPIIVTYQNIIQILKQRRRVFEYDTYLLM